MITIILDPEEVVRDCILDIVQGCEREARKLLADDGYSAQRLSELTFREYDA